jgi:hypothetical protein
MTYLSLFLLALGLFGLDPFPAPHCRGPAGVSTPATKHAPSSLNRHPGRDN